MSSTLFPVSTESNSSRSPTSGGTGTAAAGTSCTSGSDIPGINSGSSYSRSDIDIRSRDILPSSSDASHHPTRQHTYSAGIPAPPRILIPPHLAPVPGGTYPSAFISGPFADVYNAAYPSNPALSVFLGTPTDAQRWTYESRRQAQQVLPWVWLGSMTATRDKDLLAQRGITLLVAVRCSMAAKAKLLSGAPGAMVDLTSDTPLKHAPGRVGRPAYVTLDLPSTPGAPLISTFRAAAQLIDRNYLAPIISPEQLAEIDNSSEIPDYHSLVQEHYSQYGYHHPQNSAPVLQDALNPFPSGIPSPGSTLVFCETGNEKSAVVVASYIMQHFESTLVQAVQVVQGRRFSVGFDDSLKYALAAWEPIYKSYRDVNQAWKHQQQLYQQPYQGQQSQGHSGLCAKGRKKRGYEEVRNQTGEDELMVVSSQDAITTDGRSGMAPFVDVDQ